MRVWCSHSGLRRAQSNRRHRNHKQVGASVGGLRIRGERHSLGGVRYKGFTGL